jgi:hypothetical protein
MPWLGMVQKEVREYIPVAQLEEGVRFLIAVLKARTG